MDGRVKPGHDERVRSGFELPGREAFGEFHFGGVVAQREDAVGPGGDLRRRGTGGSGEDVHVLFGGVGDDEPAIIGAVVEHPVGLGDGEDAV